MKGLWIFLITALVLYGCTSRQAVAVVAELPELPAQPAEAPTAIKPAAPTAVPSPTPVDFRVIWPLGRDFADTATIAPGQTYGMDWGAGVKVFIENRSQAKIRIDEPALYYLMKHVGPCPNVPKIVVYDGNRNVGAVKEMSGVIAVTGSKQASMNSGIIFACMVSAATAWTELDTQTVYPTEWDESVHLTAVLVGMKYDEYVAFAETKGANAVECGTGDCEGYKAIAADLYSAQIRNAPLQPIEP